MTLTRGDVYLVSPAPGKDPRRARPLVVVSRQALCDSRADEVVCAPVNSNADGWSTEVPVGVAEGLKHDSVINSDQMVLVPKAMLTDCLGSLAPAKRRLLRDALRVAVEVD